MQKTVLHITHLVILVFLAILTLGFQWSGSELTTVLTCVLNLKAAYVAPLILLCIAAIVAINSFCRCRAIANSTFLLIFSALYVLIHIGFICKYDVASFALDYQWLSTQAELLTKMDYSQVFALMTDENPVIEVRMGNLFARRGFFYLYPLYMLLGSNILYVKLLNLAMMLIVGLCIFDTAKMLFNNSVARISILLFSAIPATFVGTLYPSYDVAGLFYLTLFQWALMKVLAQYATNTDKAFIIRWGVLLFIFLFLTSITRTLHLHLFLVILLATPYVIIMQAYNKKHPCSITKHILLFLCICVAPIALTKYGMQFFYPPSGINSGMILMNFNKPHYCPTGTYAPSFEFFRPMIKTFPDVSKYGASFYLSQWYFVPADMIALVVRKWHVALQLGNSIASVHNSDFRHLLTITYIWRVPFFFFILLGAVNIKQRFERHPNMVLLFFFPIVFLLIHTFVETATRYTFILNFNLSILAGVGLTHFVSKKQSIEKKTVSHITELAIIALALYAIVPPLFCRTMERSGLLMTSLRSTTPTNESENSENRMLFNDKSAVHSFFQVPMSDAMSSQTLTWEGDRMFIPGKYDITALLSIEDSSKHVFDYQLQFLGAPIYEEAICDKPIKRFIEKITVNLNQETTPTFSLVLTHQPVAHDDGTSDPCTMKGRLECVWIRPAKPTENE